MTNAFNEDNINRDASGKFASKTSGEPDGVSLGLDTKHTEPIEDVMARVAPYDDEYTLRSEAFGAPEFSNDITVAHSATGFTASTSHTGRTAGAFVKAADEAGYGPNDMADFVRSEYGASSVEVSWMQDESFSADAHFEAGLGYRAAENEVVPALRKTGLSEFIEDSRDGVALGAKFYSWKQQLDEAEESARASWSSSKGDVPFPDGYFRHQYVEDPAGTYALAENWAEGREDDGRHPIQPGNKDAFYSSPNDKDDAIYANIEARFPRSEGTYDVWTDRIGSEAFENHGDGTFTQIVDADEFTAIIDRHTKRYNNEGRRV